MDSGRFSRMRILYGDKVCDRLAASRALVCGLGAVGGYAAEILARSGVGAFILADCDVYDATNISRQIGALESTLGGRKTEVMRDRILDINPDAKVELFDEFISGENIARLLSTKPDIIVDAIDTISSKIELMKAAQACGTPLVASMGAARKTDASRVKTAPLFKTCACPVAFKIRKQLRREGLKPAFACVYSDEVPCDESHVASGSENSKKIIGSSPAITALFGVTLADLAIRELCCKTENI